MNEGFWKLLGAASATLSGLSFLTATFYYNRTKLDSEVALQGKFIFIPSLALSRFGLAWTMLLVPLVTAVAVISTRPLWIVWAPIGLALGAVWVAIRAWNAPGTTHFERFLIGISATLVSVNPIYLFDGFIRESTRLSSISEVHVVACLLGGLLWVPLSLNWLDKRRCFIRPRHDITSELLISMTAVRIAWRLAREQYEKAVAFSPDLIQRHGKSKVVERLEIVTLRNQEFEKRVANLGRRIDLILQSAVKKRIFSQDELTFLLSERADLPKELENFAEDIQEYLDHLENVGSIAGSSQRKS